MEQFRSWEIVSFVAKVQMFLLIIYAGWSNSNLYLSLHVKILGTQTNRHYKVKTFNYVVLVQNTVFIKLSLHHSDFRIVLS